MSTSAQNNMIDIANFKDLEVTFANNDTLVLRLVKGTKFYGHLKGDILELSYGEHHYGEYGSVGMEVDKTKHYYMATNTQFFPLTEFRIAVAAFFERMNSKQPYKCSEIFHSYRLEECLPVDPDELSVHQRILQNMVTPE